MTSLKGRLLVSSGGLFDPNFRHTVVLIGEHNDEGALGVVLNRPLGVSVEDAVPPLARLVDEGTALYQGGPVQPTSPVLLAEFAHGDLADLPVFENVGFLVGDVPADLRPGVLRARVYAGYSGWGPGQLEREMTEDSWIVADPRVDDVFTREPESLWKRILQRQGPEYERLSEMPFDPRMN